MADNNFLTESNAFSLQFSREAGKMRVAMPGVIQSFDPTTQTVSVIPALRMRVNLDNKVTWKDLPVIQGVPIVIPFAQGAGLLLTLPITPGDECLLVFSDRAIDYFTQSGGVQKTDTSSSEDTTTPRAHHLTDAICIPGIISNPQAVPKYSITHIEMRDRERKHFISMGPDGITISDSIATWKMAEGKVTLDAPKGIEETSESPVSRVTESTQKIVGTNIIIGAGAVDHIENTLVSDAGTFIDSAGVKLQTHTHNHGAMPDQ